MLTMSQAIVSPVDLYSRMCTIRYFEEAASRLYRDGYLPGFIHLSLGQEACAVGACSTLRDDDFITSTHRGHGHAIAKGADPIRMMAELAGKLNGYSKGRAGSMHIADVSVGMLGANGIVGQSVPLACGAAWSVQVRGTDQVALAFFGEGASGAGPVHEAMNIAALWKLPVVFFCESNRFAELSPYTTHVPIDSVAQRAAGYGFEGVVVDGTDVLAVRAAVEAAVVHARQGLGPTLVEARTHRWHGHYEGDPQNYIAKADKDPAARNDPLVHLAARADELGFDRGALERAQTEAFALIERAIASIAENQSPGVTEMLEDVYA